MSLVLGANSKGELYPPVVILKGKSHTPKNLKRRLKKSATNDEWKLWEAENNKIVELNKQKTKECKVGVLW